MGGLWDEGIEGGLLKENAKNLVYHPYTAPPPVYATDQRYFKKKKRLSESDTIRMFPFSKV